MIDAILYLLSTRKNQLNVEARSYLNNPYKREIEIIERMIKHIVFIHTIVVKGLWFIVGLSVVILWYVFGR